jgi:hypothetical protein
VNALKSTVSLLAAGLFAALGTGCSYVNSHTITYLGGPRPARSDPARIEILQAPPSRLHDRLGEIVIDASLSPAPKTEKIEGRLRSEAAKLGADAVLVAHDQAATTGYWMAGPWWNASMSQVQSRVIVGVALKYR